MTSDETIQKRVPEMLLAAGEISILLDTYDDVFSDFDPRPYARRALSDDFLQEAKKAALDKNETIELRFLIPHRARRTELESMIRQRLHEHFKRHHELLLLEMRKTRQQGLLMIFLGILTIALASYVSFQASESFFMHFLLVVLEPAGWFTAWTGMEELYAISRKTNPELSFYAKMTRAVIVFTGY